MGMPNISTHMAHRGSYISDTPEFNAQDGSEYQSVTHVHTTSTSAHINPPPDPVPLDTSDPYSKKADEEPAQHSRGSGGGPTIARRAQSGCCGSLHVSKPA